MMQAQNWKNTVKSQVSTRKSTSRGFTLIELLVVLAVAALVSALTFAGFSSMQNGHRRTSCQGNMSQLYTALRQYSADEGSFPIFDPTNNDTTANSDGRGIGLWALYAFPRDNDGDKLAPPPTQPNPRPLERYIRASKNLHCPADTDSTNLLNAAGTAYNVDYLSYQVEDTEAFLPTSGDERDQYTFVPERTDNAATANRANWRRQLVHYDGTTLVRRPPTDDTVVLWCPFHRSSTGTKLDNVLFYDGSVQVIPFNDSELAWLRNPKNPS